MQTINDLYQKALLTNSLADLHEIAVDLSDLAFEYKNQRLAINPDLPFNEKYALDCALETLEAEADLKATEVLQMYEDAGEEYLRQQNEFHQRAYWTEGSSQGLSRANMGVR